MDKKELAKKIYLNKQQFGRHVGRGERWFDQCNPSDELLFYGFMGIMRDLTILMNSIDEKSMYLIYDRLKVIGIFPTKVIRNCIRIKTNNMDWIISKVEDGSGTQNFKNELIMICNRILIWNYGLS